MIRFVSWREGLVIIAAILFFVTYGLVAARGAWFDPWILGAVGITGIALAVRLSRSQTSPMWTSLAVTFGIAFLLIPTARILFWNASSAALEAASSYARFLSSNVAGGYHPHEALWLPLYVIFLVVASAPTLLCAILAAAAPLLAGAGFMKALRSRPARRHRAAATVLAGAALVVAWVAVPVACDTHESWEDVPNVTCQCRGVELEYYPPGVSDGASTDYCLGLERDPA